MSRCIVLFSNQHYQATQLAPSAHSLGGLVVESLRKKSGNRGKYIEGAGADEWIDAIKTATDRDEAAALCRAIVNA